MKNEIRSLCESFAHAFKGIAFCVRYERNMRIHIVATTYVMLFSNTFYNLTRGELVLLILTCTLVMALELINTAVEVLTDKASPEYSSLAKAAKDTAAGAVLVAAVSAVIVGVILFFKQDKLIEIFIFFKDNLFAFIGLILSLILSLIFIFSGKKRRKRGKKEQKLRK